MTMKASAAPPPTFNGEGFLLLLLAATISEICEISVMPFDTRMKG
jgi:hypothetical protein